MTKIVGHRGAKGLELENTIPSFEAAKKLSVDAIEFDILITKDGKFVVCHDDNLQRVGGVDKHISQLTYPELAKIPLKNGHPVPLLVDVLKLIHDIPVILDIKTDQSLPRLFKVISKFPHMEFTIVTPLPHIIRECKQLAPDIPAFVERSKLPFRLLNSVEKYGADGLNLRHLWINPFTYRTAVKKGIQIQVWTVNSMLVAHVIKRLYPGIWICTNHPDRMLASFSKYAKYETKK